MMSSHEQVDLPSFLGFFIVLGSIIGLSAVMSCWDEYFPQWSEQRLAIR